MILSMTWKDTAGDAEQKIGCDGGAQQIEIGLSHAQQPRQNLIQHYQE
jgi:hypothetical protein